MSRYRISTLRFLKLALALCVTTAGWAGTFGKVISIGGQASDIALDEARGVLYVANFTANRIEVMSLADHSIQRSMNVAAQPGSLALSPDGRYLVVTHYGNVSSPGTPNNALTVIDLTSNARQTFGMGSPPLGVAFGIDGTAFIATTTEFILFDPAGGFMKVVDTVSGLTAKTLPTEAGTVVSQIVATSMAVSADGVVIYGLTDKFKFRYDSNRNFLSATQYTSSPALGPRAVSVNRDGTKWMGGWAMHHPDGFIVSQMPNVTGALNIGSV
jgi:DNA-binding beta-propeller fold protein YncE